MSPCQRRMELRKLIILWSVIETKNMKGWIFGNSKQKQWTQKIFKYSGKFQNLLHQNYKHTQTLASCLDIPCDLIYSVIVFIGGSTFKTKMPENITYARGCLKYIKSKKTQHFSYKQVAEIIQVIEARRLARGLKTNLQHNRHVQNIIDCKAEVKTKPPSEQKEIPVVKKVNQAPVKLVCPKCGSTMLLRKAKKGKNAGNDFWGCSHFPKCRTVVG
jgi:restriction system protein